MEDVQEDVESGDYPVSDCEENLETQHKNQCQDQKFRPVSILVKNGTTKPFDVLILDWPDNLTVLDLSDKGLINFNENLVFPPCLQELNLSRNSITTIPTGLLNLEIIKLLNLSHNEIQFFDDYPQFCHCIEELDMSNNELEGPPYWVWMNAPEKLVKVNISCNRKLTKSLSEEYLDELHAYSTLATQVKDLIIYKCNIKQRRALQLLGIFANATKIAIGLDHLTNSDVNTLSTIPCAGLETCYEVETLDLCNTRIYTVASDIEIYKNLKELNLSFNQIRGLPDSFGNLENLEVCNLSYNNILYLPDTMTKLKKLVCLRLSCNDLCMVSENLSSLPNLKILDLYENSLYEFPNEVNDIQELDLAQNFLKEPVDAEYLKKKEKLRSNISSWREDGSKAEKSPTLSEHSSTTTDDEELMEYINKIDLNDSRSVNEVPSPCSEDWDDDEYWTPGYPVNRTIHPSQAPWLTFAKKMMDAGNFCPMDNHQASIAETVQYNKFRNPKVKTVVKGQFDDYPDDENRVLCLKK